MPEEINNNIPDNNDTNNSPEQVEQKPQTQQKENDKAPQIDYEALYGTDKTLQSFVDKAVTKATQTAVQNALQKQQRLNDEQLSESERLKEMTAEQRALYFEQKYKDAEKARARDKEVESLKTQTISMLAESGVPDIFLDVFDFNNATAEDIRQRVSMLGEYEYYPKGEFKKQLDAGIIAGVNEKLKQAPLETHADSGGSNKPSDLPTFF
jgi:hypothetical protein